VAHDALGRPLFEYAAPLAKLLAQRGLVAHLSISDEHDYAVAFVIMEHRTP
jgi:holo-[acyl-carrier protein] synthase